MHRGAARRGGALRDGGPKNRHCASPRRPPRGAGVSVLICFGAVRTGMRSNSPDNTSLAHQQAMWIRIVPKTPWKLALDQGARSRCASDRVELAIRGAEAYQERRRAAVGQSATPCAPASGFGTTTGVSAPGRNHSTCAPSALKAGRAASGSAASASGQAVCWNQAVSRS
jgi:hypothetical protein